jgi:hypothetical protein
VIEGFTIERRSRDDAIKILGTLISCDGRMDIELAHRITAVWNSFHQHRDTLCCKDVSLGKRIKLLQIIGEPALFWCSGAWKLNTEQYANLRGVQRHMLLKMMRPRRRPGESDEDFYPRIHGNVTKAMDKHSFIAWDLRSRDYYFKWAGSVSRMTLYDKDRLAPKALHFMNIDSVRDFAKRNNGNQGHGRHVHVWRWESDVHDFGKYEDTGWEVLAANTQEWFTGLLDKFRYARVVRDNLLVRGHKRHRT